MAIPDKNTNFILELLRSTYLTNKLLGELSVPTNKNHELFVESCNNFITENKFDKLGISYKSIAPFNHYNYISMLYAYCLGLNEIFDNRGDFILKDHNQLNSYSFPEIEYLRGSKFKSEAHKIYRLRNSIAHFNFNYDYKHSEYLFSDWKPGSTEKKDFVQFKVSTVFTGQTNDVIILINKLVSILSSYYGDRFL